MNRRDFVTMLLGAPIAAKLFPSDPSLITTSAAGPRVEIPHSGLCIVGDVARLNSDLTAVSTQYGDEYEVWVFNNQLDTFVKFCPEAGEFLTPSAEQIKKAHLGERLV